MELEQVVIAFQKKDKAAFEQLYSMYKQSLFGVIYGIVKDDALAEEVLNDVFVKAWKKSHQYTAKKGRIFTWLLNISRNAAIDKVRSKSYRNSKKNLDSSIFVNIIETHDKTAQHIDIQYVKSVLQTLKEKCISVLELIYFKGYTQREVSEELEIPLGTVKTRNRNCVKELREMLVGA